MKDFFESCNTYQGRWNRKKFWLYPLWMAFLLIFPLSFLASFVGVFSSTLWKILWLLVFISYFYILYINIWAYIKRFHDLWKSGWYCLLVFVPFLNLGVLIWVGFFEWMKWPNMYGPDPLQESSPAPVTQEWFVNNTSTDL